MKINSKWMTMAAALTMTATLAVAAPGEGTHGKHGKHGRHGRGGSEFSQRFAEKLNLTDAQKAQVQEIRRASAERNKALYESARDTFQQFRAAKKANDTARVDALKPQVESLRTQMKQLRQAEQASIVAILNAEQRAQFEALKAERESKRGERGERGKRHRSERQ